MTLSEKLSLVSREIGILFVILLYGILIGILIGILLCEIFRSDETPSDVMAGLPSDVMAGCVCVE